MNAKAASGMIGPMTVVPGRREATTQDFQSMFVAHYTMVVRTVRLIVHDHAVAEEATRDAFVQLLRNWRKVSAYERPDLWVRRVAIRQGQRQVHRDRQRSRLELVSLPTVATTDSAPDDEVLDAVRELPPGQRAVVVLFYLEDRPMGEIADIPGCSVSTGWSQLHTARKRLAAALFEEVDPDVR
ncbi:sigma-70 family RNA polymerase sigma factor [Nocardioides sp. B-3]|uniref:sigma-70 family RNA polymerase sigma factor n=1 Tax=Nocardioides sp. B-3 TaxID=2895565 RepID=UPI0021538FCD|nr:sigma-70 family RNA polymerase sigma factor [Nocardioides sp. B-3]UUZ58417.1 sigma-70 family RNA polymerase sigma factor [Nocardioides sp. B-3]